MYYRADAGMLVKSSIGVLESRVTFAALAVVVFIVDSRGATRALSGAMFGRFGRGGGNFVAQYRVYPVSFVDKVRLLPSPARAVPQSGATVTHPRSRDARESSPDGSGPSVPPGAALTPSTPLATSQSSRRTRLRMETRVSHRQDGPFAPEAQTLAPLGHRFKTSDGSRAANSDPRLTPPAPSPPQSSSPRPRSTG